MSTAAKTLLSFAHDLRFVCTTENTDRAFCMYAARAYAAHIIAKGVQ